MTSAKTATSFVVMLQSIYRNLASVLLVIKKLAECGAKRERMKWRRASERAERRAKLGWCTNSARGNEYLCISSVGQDLQVIVIKKQQGKKRVEGRNFMQNSPDDKHYRLIKLNCRTLILSLSLHSLQFNSRSQNNDQDVWVCDVCCLSGLIVKTSTLRRAKSSKSHLTIIKALNTPLEHQKKGAHSLAKQKHAGITRGIKALTRAIRPKDQ